jgi:predicted  nucleic acid-binding Zn-ribbon protein
MTVIKFKGDQKPSAIIPGVNNTISRVFDAVVKYALKENLPSSAERDELIFTIDTHEFFRGNGKGLDLIPLNTVLMYSSFGEFPAKGLDAKIYVDKSNSLMFTWNGNGYVQMNGGEGGEIIIAPSDAKIGDLSQLKTANKETVVKAINEVFDKLKVVDVEALKDSITAVEGSVTKIVSNVTVLENTVADIDASIEKVNKAIGALPALKTTSKLNLVAAINELALQVSDLVKAGGDVEDIAQRLDQLKTVLGDILSLDTAANSDIVSAINELVATITGVDKALKAEISAVKENIQSIESALVTNEADIKKWQESSTSIESRLSALEESRLTADEKTAFDTLVNEVIPQLQATIVHLEQDVKELKAYHEPSDPVVTEPEPGPGGSGPSSWGFEFVLPVGVPTYDLDKDATWIASGNTIDIMDDLFGGTQRVRLYSLGNAQYAPTAPIEVPLVGEPGTPPTDHGIWESYTGEEIVFQSASLIAWRFRLVKA